MSEIDDTPVPVDLVDDPTEIPSPVDPEPAQPAPARQAPSLLDQVAAVAGEAIARATKVLPVGRTGRIFAEYRALEEDELDDLTRRLEAKSRLQRKVSRGAPSRLAELNDRYALLMVESCVELLWLDDEGRKVPLHIALELPAPVRYNRELLTVLRLADRLELDPETASGTDVARELHRWGKPPHHNYAPLRTLGGLLDQWTSGVAVEAAAEALEGN